MSRAAAAALAAAAVLAHAGVAAAGTIFLVSPVAPVTPPPPLPASASAVRSQTETRFLGHLSSRELVRVGVTPDGDPARVVVTQRLVLNGTGDYFFVVAAPATRVVPGPGSESLPGLRDLGIVWQGFSDRRRVLSATATLRVQEAARGLPLRIRVDRRAGSTVVRLENATEHRVGALTGRSSFRALERVLADLRAAYRQSATGVVAGAWEVDGDVGKPVQLRAVAPLRVRGSISARGRRAVPVDVLLGGRAPLERAFVLPGRVEPRVELRVELLSPPEILPTAGELAAARDPVRALQLGLASVATSWWYRHYLGSPGTLDPSSAIYAYRTVAPAATAVPPSHGGGDTLAIVLGATLGAAALAGLAVLWAHS